MDFFVITRHQEDFDILVECGMDYTQEPVKAIHTGMQSKVTFKVTQDIVNRLLAKTKKPKITGIERRFQEAMLNDMDYGQPVEGDYVPDISYE